MLTPEQRVAAVAEGWLVTTVFDNGSTKPYWMIVRHGSRFASDREAGAFVVQRARGFSKFHQSVLGAIATSRMAATPRKKK